MLDCLLQRDFSGRRRYASRAFIRYAKESGGVVAVLRGLAMFFKSGSFDNALIIVPTSCNVAWSSLAVLVFAAGTVVVTVRTCRINCMEETGAHARFTV